MRTVIATVRGRKLILIVSAGTREKRTEARLIDAGRHHIQKRHLTFLRLCRTRRYLYLLSSCTPFTMASRDAVINPIQRFVVLVRLTPATD